MKKTRHRKIVEIIEKKGSMVKTAEEVQALLHEKGYRASIINARFIKPIDEEAVLSACEDHDMIVTMEENVLSGGVGEKVLTCLNDHDRQIKCVMAGIPVSISKGSAP